MYKRGKYKQMGSIKCPPHMSKDGLKDWWLNFHSINGRLVPGLKYYTINFTLDDSPFGVPPFDGYADNLFESIELLKEGGTSDVMKEQIEDVRKHKLDDPTLCKIAWAEEYIIDVPNGLKEQPHKNRMYKQMGIIKCPSYMTKDELKDWWLNVHVKIGRNFPGLQWFTVNFTIEDTPFGLPPFDGYAETWFEDFEKLKQAYDSDIMKASIEDVAKHKLDDPELTQVVWAEANIIEIPH
jgi:uncharacterized protein (TIGR02118 family)